MKNFSLRTAILGVAALAAVAFVPVASATPYVAGSFTTTGNGTLQQSGSSYTLGYNNHVTSTSNKHYDQSAGGYDAGDSTGYFSTIFDASAGNWYTTGATQVNANGPNKYVTGRSQSAYTFTSASIGTTLTPSDPFEVISEGTYTLNFYITSIDTGSVILSVAPYTTTHPTVHHPGNDYSFTGEGYVTIYNGGTLVATELGTFGLSSNTPAAPSTNKAFQLTFLANAPEPSSFVLLGSGLLAMAMVLRRKQAIV